MTDARQILRMGPRHSAVGTSAAVVTSDAFATQAAIDILAQGGSAVDAMIAAAAVQCVVENGSTTIAGMWISHSYNAHMGRTETVNSMIGPAAAEPYDYGMESPEAYGGRAMPVPGWVAGAHLSWERDGRLPWADLFQPAIALADDGFELDQAGFARLKLGTLGGRTAAGREIWMRDGRYVGVGERVHQPALARTIQQVAEDGPAAFYDGDFAQQYVETSRALGGSLTMDDLARWSERAAVKESKLEGDYGGFQVVTEGALMTYALHLFQAADLGALSEADSVYAHVRVMEEVFCSTRDYSDSTHDRFVDPGYAKDVIDTVLNQAVRPVGFDMFWGNTNTLAVRDGDGNLAWLVHSINTPALFGAGIVVGGAYAVRAINKRHAHTGYLLQPGLFTSLTLYRDGKPYAVAGSPGFGCMHGPTAFMAELVLRGRDPLEAVKAPRFGLPSPLTADRPPFEGHYPPAVFEMLDLRDLPYFACQPTNATGVVGAIVINGESVHAVQDVRGDGTAAAI